jgi:hypothetical protein
MVGLQPIFHTHKFTHLQGEFDIATVSCPFCSALGLNLELVDLHTEQVILR